MAQSTVQVQNGNTILGSGGSSGTVTNSATLVANTLVQGDGGSGLSSVTAAFVNTNNLSVSNSPSAAGTRLGTNGNVDASGTINAGLSVTAPGMSTSGSAGFTASAGNFQCAAGKAFYWTGRSDMTSPAAGRILLFDDSIFAFYRLTFGGENSTSASFTFRSNTVPSIVLLAGDGAGTENLIISGGLTVTNNITLNTTNAAPAGFVVGTTVPAVWFAVTNAGNRYLIPGYTP